MHGWAAALPNGAISISFRLLRLASVHAPVAQLDRAPDFGSGGWGFDSLRARFSP